MMIVLRAKRLDAFTILPIIWHPSVCKTSRGSTTLMVYDARAIIRFDAQSVLIL